MHAMSVLNGEIIFRLTSTSMIIKFRKVTCLAASNLRIEGVISCMKKVVLHTLTLEIINSTYV